MPGEGSSINMISLGEFNTRLAGRLSEARTVLTSLQHDATLTSGGIVKVPQLGTFDDAVKAEQAYTALYHQFEQRVQQLHNAITAAQKATTTIAANYHTTESLNAAQANEIKGALSTVPTALGEQP
ncbi:hypothetical protein Dvina_30860 [Dactylosporangium vinaceum]|uniref:hypothetical protein n=1 Tax=Dactylosporangium vinaceum TaxID=53362 RepID=UPI001CA830B1|nr:hypothetical protein [Dactylosporangium vinaceum]UAB92718.1 hypothetical protein Dvina_30860 [Dactylosporangium vinaceum]